MVLEASGGYEQALLVELVSADIGCARVNPVDLRYFARLHHRTLAVRVARSICGQMKSTCPSKCMPDLFPQCMGVATQGKQVWRT